MGQRERGRNQTGGCLGLIVVTNSLVMYGQRETEERLGVSLKWDIYLYESLWFSISRFNGANRISPDFSLERLERQA